LLQQLNRKHIYLCALILCAIYIIFDVAHNNAIIHICAPFNIAYSSSSINSQNKDRA